MTRSDIERLRAFHGGVPNPSGELLGSKVLELDRAEGRAVVEFAARPEFCNPMGRLQGGFIAAMLDEAMSIAGVAKGGFRYYLPTLEMKTSFIKPAKPGRLIAEGRVQRLTRAIAFLEGRLTDPDEALIATATATAMLARILQAPQVEDPS